ncbi:fumarylacetoacetate hydrolase family protein [Sphingobacterium alkalisoli]|uniref:Fumarylacetoacetate hydrolase family protein n=1 Tax=Sphingobacterium alkalisoli TaxID=1874115 RepID=A0A4V5LYY1_9SPHI|nr:fumarylacetoacetate hydrolase family protein [Sphingobacterium alkalisoli]TJY68329.1 fumarylacetoacetate hydrolase family protein [Sphingobacterium alkalisoli]GGH07253.1 2-hydroxyhepta-2,4-diene-1,7-dioate isomerase [Sphingobacterium alkalisoli]
MKVIAVGRNYVDHAKELNNPVPEKPVIFMKPDTAILKDNKDFYYPEFSNDVHFEVEVVIRICNEGKHVSPKYAYKYYDALGLGIDFTARDIQSIHKEKGLPWELAKAFDHSAVISNLIPKEEFENVKELAFSLSKNGITVQEGNTKNVMFDFDSLIVFISKYITLRKGDLIYTGTPAGVGPVQIGDQLEGFLEGRSMFICNIK